MDLRYIFIDVGWYLGSWNNDICIIDWQTTFWIL